MGVEAMQSPHTSAASSRAIAGLGGTSSSRLVAAARSNPGLTMRQPVQDDSEDSLSQESMLSWTGGGILGYPPQAPLTRETGLTSNARQGTVSSAMERVIRLERARAGKAYRRNMSSMWSSMHYILRTARCLHAWRSDTVQKIRQQYEEELAALRKPSEYLQEKLDEMNRALTEKVKAVNEGDQALNAKVKELSAIVENLEKERARQQEELILTRDSARRGAEALAQRTEELVSAQVEIKQLLGESRARSPALENIQFTIAEHPFEKELERLRKALEQREQDIVQQTRQYDADRSIMTEMRLKIQEELSQAKQGILEKDWSFAKCQEELAKQEDELIFLRGTVKRMQEMDENRLDSCKREIDETHRVLNVTREELRSKVIELHHIGHKFELEIKKLEMAMGEQQDQVRKVGQRCVQLESECRAHIDQHESHKTEMERQRLETQRIRNELTQIEERCRIQTAELEATRAAKASGAATVEHQRAALREALASKDVELAYKDRELDAITVRMQEELKALNNRIKEMDLIQRDRMQEMATIHREELEIKNDRIKELLASEQGLLQRSEAQEKQLQYKIGDAETAQHHRSLPEIAAQLDELVMLRGTIRRKDEEKLRLELEISSLRGSIADLEVQIRQKQEEIKFVSEDAETALKDQVYLVLEAQKSAAAFESDVAEMRQQIDRLKGQHQEQLKELLLLREDRGAELVNKTSEIQRLQAELANNSSENQRLQTEIRSMSHKIEESFEELDKIRNDLALTKDDHQLVSEALASKDQELAMKNRALQEMDLFHKDHIQEKDMIHIEELKDLNNRHIEELKDLNNRHKEELKDFSIRLQELEMLLKQRADQVSALLESEEQQRGKIQSMEIEIGEKQNALCEDAALHGELHGELVMLRGTIRRKDEEKLRLELEISSLRESIADLEVQIRQNSFDAETALKDQVYLTQQAQKRAAAFESEVAEVRQQMDGLRKEEILNRALQENVTTKSLEIERLQTEIGNMSQKVEEGFHELDRTRNDLALREDDHQLVSEALAIKDQELAMKDRALDVLKKENDAKDQELDAQDKQLKEAIALLEKEKEKLRRLADIPVAVALLYDLDYDTALSTPEATIKFDAHVQEQVSTALGIQPAGVQVMFHQRGSVIAQVVLKQIDMPGGGDDRTPAQLAQELVEMQNDRNGPLCRRELGKLAVKSVTVEGPVTASLCDSVKEEEMHLREKISLLETDIAQNEKQQREAITLRATVRRGNEEKENLEGQIAELQASLGHAHRDLQQREIDRADRCAELANMTSENQQVQAELLIKISEIQLLQTELVNKTSEIQRLQTELANNSSENQRLQTEIRSMSQKIEESFDTLDKIRNDLALKEDDHQLVSEALASKDQELAMKNSELDATNLRMQEMNFFHRDHIQEKDMIHIEELKDLNNRILELEMLLKQRTDQVSVLLASEEQQREKIQSMEIEIGEKQNAMWDAAAQQEELVMLRGTVRRKDEEKLRLELEISSLRESITDLEVQIRQKRQEIELVSEDAETALKDQVYLTQQAQKRAAAFESEVAEVRQQMDGLRKEEILNRALQENLANKSLEIERLQTEIGNMSQKVEEGFHELDRTRNDLALREDDHQLVSEALAIKDQELAMKDRALDAQDKQLKEAIALLEKEKEKLRRLADIPVAVALLYDLDYDTALSTPEATIKFDAHVQEQVSTALGIQPAGVQVMFHQRGSVIAQVVLKQIDMPGGGDDRTPAQLAQALVEMQNDRNGPLCRRELGKLAVKSVTVEGPVTASLCDSVKEEEMHLREKISLLETDIAQNEKQQREAITLRATVRRGNEEKENLEGQIAELQASLGHAHRDLQQREIDLNEHVKSTVAQELKQRHEDDMQTLKLRHEADMQELKLRLEADISAIQRAHEEGVAELRRVNDAAISVLKGEHAEKISDMRAKLDYEVENKTLQLKIQLFECKADLEAARKAETGAQEILTAARAREERLHSEISSKMLEIMALRASFEEELKSLRNSLEEPLSKLEKETAAKSMTIHTLEADLEEARKSLADRERDFKELQAEEEKIRAEHFLSLQAEHKEREDERKGWEAKRLQTAHDIENMKSDLIEKDAIIDKYLLLVEDLRQELDTTRTDFQSIQTEKMKIQEENVVVRGAIRRKDDERQKIDAENLELLDIIRRKDQEIGQAYDKCRTLVSEAKTELDEKNSIIEKLKSDVLAIETLAKQNNHKRLEEKEEVERKLDLEKRDLFREVEHSNLVLAQKLKDISSLELEVESLKQELKELRQLHEEELKQLNDQIRFHQDDLDLKDQELIDFKGKHVAVVEALQLDLRKAQQDFTRLDAINKEVQTQLSNQKEQIATLRKMEALVLSKDQTIKELERTKETIIHELNGELVSTQEQVDALQKQIENLNHEIQDLQSDLEREVSAHEPLKKELVLLRGEVRRKGDQLSKMEESHGKIHVKKEELHNTSHERTGGQQDELEGLWRALTRKEEEISDLKNALASAQSKIEDLQNTERKFKELKTMMRGKVQLEKRDLVVTTVKTRKVEDQISSLVQQIALERSRRQQLQLSWASLESAISIMCPRLAEARFHLVFTAKQSLFENEVNNDGIHVRGPMYLWLRGMFAHALGVDASAISVSHITYGARWVSVERSVDDQLHSWAPQVPEGYHLSMALVRFHTVKGSGQSGFQLAENFCSQIKKTSSALCQQLGAAQITVLGCLPPQKTLPGEERMLPSEVAERMVVVEDLGFSLVQDQNGEYLISYVLAGSLASEYEKMNPGDVIKEIDGIPTKNRPVPEINKLLTGRAGGTIAIMVCKGHEYRTPASAESNLVIMVRPSAAPTPSPLAMARESMSHPDLSELISAGDLNVSILPQPSFYNTFDINFNFDESIGTHDPTPARSKGSEGRMEELTSYQSNQSQSNRQDAPNEGILESQLLISKLRSELEAKQAKAEGILRQELAAKTAALETQLRRQALETQWQRQAASSQASQSPEKTQLRLQASSTSPDSPPPRQQPTGLGSSEEVEEKRVPSQDLVRTAPLQWDNVDL